jgi:large subunit ribosomal protein L21
LFGSGQEIDKAEKLNSATCTAVYKKEINMTYAVIEICGKQLKVEPGRFYDLDRIDVELDGDLVIEKVLLIHHQDQIHIGQPYIEGGSVSSTIIGHRRGKKVIVYKMQPKKKTRKKRGHRQELSRLMINSISLDGKLLAQKSTEAVEAEVAVGA